MRSFIKKVTSSFWVDKTNLSIDGYPKTMRLVVGGLLGSAAVIFQSAGVFTGIGFILSMMSTGPLVLASLVSLKIGVMTYFVSAFLLVMLQPSELLVFLFTTGLLGLSLGIGLKYLKKSVLTVAFAALNLTLGISLLLYVIKFPILGPSVSLRFDSVVLLGIFAFCLLYSWIWMKVSISAFKVLQKIVLR